MATKFLKDLERKRKQWIRSTKENDFNQEILLSQLYPDKAHFIYELLQNAEDAQANWVSFDLSGSKLVFIHNGRPFNGKDVDGITSIGRGTKADDINQIGEFGVGFKAVFSYTKTPEIYSGEYNFLIQDLVVPIQINNSNTYNSYTTIILPLNNENKKTQIAIEEIKKGLRKLDESSLLFLSNIKEINCTINGKKFSLKRKESDSVRISITNSNTNKSTDWLRFKKYINDSKSLFVSLAFKVEKIENKSQIVPINGHVSIYFPTTKETSNLKFHIHAPFSSTVARDSIIDNNKNDKLRDSILELIPDALDYIERNEISDFSFMRCLPIVDDNLPEFYYPFMERFVYMFNNRNHLLTENKNFRPAQNCFRAPRSVKNLISINDFSLLIGLPTDAKAYWIINPPQRNSREDKFIQSLAVREYTSKDIVNAFIELIDSFRYIDENAKERFNQIFSDKSNDWIKNLYSLLYEGMKSFIFRYDDLKMLIKLQNGSFNFEKKDCFFIPETNKDTTKDFIVHPDVYDDSEDKDNSKKFLEKLGVKQLELKDEINLILESYENVNEIDIADHKKHFQQFLNYYEDKRDVTLFKNKYLLVNEDNELVPPDYILVDEPYAETYLRYVKGTADRKLLSDIYFELSKQATFKKFLSAIGAHFSLPIEKRGIEEHREYDELIDREGSESEYTKNEDFFIFGKKRLSQEDYNYSWLVWNAMKNRDKRIFEAKYRRVKNSEMKTKPSSLIITLKESPWIPDKEGVFHKPEDISLDSLDKKFADSYNNSNGWLDEINFGKKLKQTTERYQQLNKILKEEYGYELNFIEKLLKANPTEEDLKSFFKLIESRKQNQSKEQNEEKPSLKSAFDKHRRDVEKNDREINPSIVKDEIEYRKKSQENYNKKLRKSNKNIQYSYNASKVKVGKDETRDFLITQYHGHCQICGFTFDKKNGHGKYFEVFDWFSEKISKQKINIIDAGSSLSLCPNCHAALKYGDFDLERISILIEEEDELKQKSFEDFTELLESKTGYTEIPEIFDFIEMDMYKIPIRLLNKPRHIYYTEEHFLLFYNLMTMD